jgi:hypothetical protein
MAKRIHFKETDTIQSKIKQVADRLENDLIDNGIHFSKVSIDMLRQKYDFTVLKNINKNNNAIIFKFVGDVYLIVNEYEARKQIKSVDSGGYVYYNIETSDRVIMSFVSVKKLIPNIKTKKMDSWHLFHASKSNNSKLGYNLIVEYSKRSVSSINVAEDKEDSNGTISFRLIKNIVDVMKAVSVEETNRNKNSIITKMNNILLSGKVSELIEPFYDAITEKTGINITKNIITNESDDKKSIDITYELTDPSANNYYYNTCLVVKINMFLGDDKKYKNVSIKIDGMYIQQINYVEYDVIDLLNRVDQATEKNKYARVNLSDITKCISFPNYNKLRVPGRDFRANISLNREKEYTMHEICEALDIFKQLAIGFTIK